MEQEQKKPRLSRKNEARRLLKGCFEDTLFSFVPFEIWRDIVLKLDLKSMTKVAQTCWGFKELVDNAGENDFDLALGFRKEGQIEIALRYLKLCANHGNHNAMFHIGNAYWCSGFGLIDFLFFFLFSCFSCILLITQDYTVLLFLLKWKWKRRRDSLLWFRTNENVLFLSCEY